MVIIQHFESLRLEQETICDCELEDKPFGSGLVNNGNTDCRCWILSEDK